ncbi:universal stress protein [Gloeobacter kilaueensis]|uniref:UspA domain-containing protein n=1 Tax=Gloeobacter kilaueensis (strain ATCC BAA-2537 / CCAP 1431/1 / ULC 316 / JS1) TaxID=1183438 RepID=U5QF59_GLOK1|nr:universal stress protein [Gloeobacter kilaueensis]AGY57566.1 UspA domain-containing protein [Gloeobacter kilaueensis JS1]
MFTRRRLRTGGQQGSGADADGEQKPTMLKTVLVAVDSSDFAWRVIEALQTLQLAPNCLVVLTHIVPPPAGEDFVEADVPQEQEGVPEPIAAENWLEALSARVDFPIAREVVTGDAAEEIVRLAGIHRCELIVIGSRGLKGLDRVIRGSVSSEVVADAPCSVLVVRG